MEGLLGIGPGSSRYANESNTNFTIIERTFSTKVSVHQEGQALSPHRGRTTVRLQIGKGGHCTWEYGHGVPHSYCTETASALQEHRHTKGNEKRKQQKYPHIELVFDIWRSNSISSITSDSPAMVVSPFWVSRKWDIPSWELLVREARSHLDSCPTKFQGEHKFCAGYHTSSVFSLRLLLAKSEHYLEPR